MGSETCNAGQIDRCNTPVNDLCCKRHLSKLHLLRLVSPCNRRLVRSLVHNRLFLHRFFFLLINVLPNESERNITTRVVLLQFLGSWHILHHFACNILTQIVRTKRCTCVSARRSIRTTIALRWKCLIINAKLRLGQYCFPLRVHHGFLIYDLKKPDNNWS